MNKVKVSIVIPVYNGGGSLRQLLEAIYQQSLSDELEVIVIDSGSTDGSLNIIQQFPVHLHQIANNEFNHGLTRNLGAQLAKGEYVIMTVQDALPSSNSWIEELLSGFVDKNVVGVCGQQIVPHHKDYNPFEWFRPQTKPEIKKYQFSSKEDFSILSPEEKKRICGWDNVTAIYRRNCLLSIPFRKLDFAEDAAWAKDVIQQGKSIVYNPNAKVHHFHFHSKDYTYKRTFFVHFYRFELFHFVPTKKVNPTMTFLKKIRLLLFRTPNISFSEKIQWWSYETSRQKYIDKATLEFLYLLNEGYDVLRERYLILSQKIPVANQQKTI